MKPLIKYRYRTVEQKELLKYKYYSIEGWNGNLNIALLAYIDLVGISISIALGNVYIHDEHFFRQELLKGADWLWCIERTTLKALKKAEILDMEYAYKKDKTKCAV